MKLTTNDSNFFVREVGRGSGVVERSLELAEVLRLARGRKEMMETGSRQEKSQSSNLFEKRVAPFGERFLLHMYTLLLQDLNPLLLVLGGTVFNLNPLIRVR